MIELGAGRYTGDYIIEVSGTSEAPILIRPEAGAHVIIDGAPDIRGAHVWLVGVEVCYSGWTKRVTALPTHLATDMPSNKVLRVFGAGVKLINCIIHDLRTGIGFWSSAVDAEIYGCLIYNTDFIGDGVTQGHAIYTQNATGTKRIRNTVIAQNYSDWGIHAYTQSGALEGFEFEDIVHFPWRLLVGGTQPVDRLTIRRVIVLGRLELGYGANTVNGSATVEDVTTIMPTRYLGDWGTDNERVTATNHRESMDGLNEVHIVANEYDDDRATVTILNAALASSVDVDLSALPLTIGREYVLRNAQNYYGDTPVSFTFTGAAVSVTMSGWTVAVPIGASEPITASTFPAFGAFILEST